MHVRILKFFSQKRGGSRARVHVIDCIPTRLTGQIAAAAMQDAKQHRYAHAASAVWRDPYVFIKGKDDRLSYL